MQVMLPWPASANLCRRRRRRLTPEALIPILLDRIAAVDVRSPY
jgi:hypothetical protein